MKKAIKRIANTPLLCNDDLKKIGFVSIPHFTIGNSVTYDLGRNRYLSASSIGTPNEFLYICEKSDKDDKVVTDLICLHNYDYDGYLDIKKVKSLIELLKSKK